jgi:predicted acyltransferase
MTNLNTESKRVSSIDALRGFDMLMIIFADRFFRTLHKGADTGITAKLAEQFQHPEWFGFHFYDIIMPLFLFIVGAVIPFSLGRRTHQSSSSSVHFHLLRRFIILFILGWIVQGRLLEFDINRFHVFSNTLQAIAVGYLFASLAFMHLSQKGKYILFGSCLVLYALLLTLPVIPGLGRSELLPDKNFALYIDKLVLGRFDDGLQYTWVLSGLGFIATTMSGMFAGELIKSKLSGMKITSYLTLIGFGGIILGLVLGIWHPIVKKIWTTSFVLLTSGMCFLLLAFFYWIMDVKKITRWAFPLRVIGMNAITAYVVSHVVNFPQLAHGVLHGLEQFSGNWYNLITATGGFLILYALLWYMYSNKTFIKI